ncbi:hypothetical protein F518_03541 [Serratia marcescens VGH107]|nr:hypothetical protein F518_03541 [Serratia marcescens VGH107]
MILPFDGGQSLAWLYLDDSYAPSLVNRVLSTVASLSAGRMAGHCSC